MCLESVAVAATGATAVVAGLHGTEVAAGTLAARMAFGRLGQFGTAEEVEAVDGVEHHVGVEHVRPCVGARQCGERTGDFALLPEEVEAFEAQGEGFVFEHRLRDRGVPLQFVGVEFGRREPAARGHAQVGGEGHAPRQGDVGRGAVGEAPRVEPGGGE